MILPFSEIMEAVKERLKYIAGKRGANDTSFYYRHTACVADMGILLTFARQTLTWVSLSLGSCCGGYTIEGDVVTFNLKSRMEDTATLETTVRPLLLECIILGIILRWLRLTGFHDVALFESQAEEMLASLVESLRLPSSLTPRPLSPI